MPQHRVIDETNGSSSLNELFRHGYHLMRDKVRNPQLEVHLLLGHVLNRSRSWLITHPETTIFAAERNRFTALLQRRLSGEPVAYLRGYCEFYDIEVAVDKRVLIPRQESELLVDLVLAIKNSDTSVIPKLQAREFTLAFPLIYKSSTRIYNLLELGTGSGAVSIAIAKCCPDMAVLATDISRDALMVATANCEKYALNNLSFIKSDWYDQLSTNKFDAIISNPPYIAITDDALNNDGVRFEPLYALTDMQQGLNAIKLIIDGARNFLYENGLLLLEHGCNQADDVVDMMRNNGFSKVITCKDYAGLDRVTMGVYVEDSSSQ